MQATKQVGWVIVSISSEDTTTFNRQFPCSNIPDGAQFSIELESRNGDLVNITMRLEDGQYVDSSDYDGSALLALAHDANNFSVQAGLLPHWATR
jgi:hypothetical protein